MAFRIRAEIAAPLIEGGDGEQARVVGALPRSFPSAEEEELVLDDGSAERSAIDVMQAERSSAAVVEEVPGLQVPVIPERERPHRAAHLFPISW